MEIEVQTVKHLVFDDTEAKNMTFTLFDDKSDGSGKTTLFQGRCESSDLQGDWSEIYYHTHD